ncbi:hypothetical protein AAE478_008769 [Parahypoxylon ruwenzoriense]
MLTPKNKGAFTTSTLRYSQNELSVALLWIGRPDEKRGKCEKAASPKPIKDQRSIADRPEDIDSARYGAMIISLMCSRGR